MRNKNPVNSPDNNDDDEDDDDDGDNCKQKYNNVQNPRSQTSLLKPFKNSSLKQSASLRKMQLQTKLKIKDFTQTRKQQHEHGKFGPRISMRIPACHK